MIACDMDGVVTNFIEGYTQVMHRMFGGPVVHDYSLVKHWEPKRWYWTENYSDNKNEVVWSHIKNSPHFWHNLTPLFRAQMPFLAQIHRRNIVFMTRRDGPNAWGQTVDWLIQHGIDEPLVVRVGPGEEKQHLCRDLGITVLIDDAPRYITSALKDGLTVVKLEWPYNEHVSTPYTAKTLAEAITTALSIEGSYAAN